MRLIDLGAKFIRYEASGGQTFHVEVDTIEEAQGVAFLCPACIKAYGGPVGTHSVICWSSSRGVPDGVHPQPGRWTLEGTGLHDLTLGCEPKKSNSVLLISKCAWHGFITNGEVINA